MTTSETPGEFRYGSDLAGPPQVAYPFRDFPSLLGPSIIDHERTD
ncbi:hypothetical protein [Novipirellula rosea]